ncbi:hypothetical protein M378DRAFT_185469 [Amanita muscaria Koide BX008]|uniref:Phospholipase n=1 Tax=Amanita muscaria (strain Koide BX008) TaxID=946122 RepID=A0A0C2SWL3_AMAMK|nr:hypothetical protein M378DRAFT_185469 [Amanita muscaria Koide BX008]
MRRVVSAPHGPDPYPTSARKGWGRIQSYFLPSIAHSKGRSTTASHSSVVASSVNIADELSVGGMAPLILRLWFEQDEKGHRRIPVLLQRLRLHVSDSFNSLHMQKSVFRIECEYANGARWVVYRDLHDFLSLHLHYTVSNVYHHDNTHFPDFPRNSIPYLTKLLNKEDARDGRELALLQRAALEDYLVKLMRSVMFLPSANRLASFLELSSLFIRLARSGGHQYKAGYLKIQSVASGDGFGPKSGSQLGRKEERWCALRDSYLVFLDDPGETSVWDVFLLDPFFDIQRPKRYYRQGLSLLRPSSSKSTASLNGAPRHQEKRALLSYLPNPFSRTNLTPNESDPFQVVLGQSAAYDLLSTPILDPSTNLNPLGRDQYSADDNDRTKETKEAASSDVSKHTFYIVNSQMRLKLRARSERQMQQWITALQKASNHCPYAGKNRFNSFAPVRLNVAAQWLVDGRDYFWNLSRAILLAKECIYIHDWWLSPELELRRPGKEHYRIDRLLQRKATEGVKIYIILYQEVFSRTTPTDSNYTKQRLMSLHRNILVQRSPSHVPTGTFYWAHHEKLCVIDQTIVFMGGLDLCFGRWDTPQHALIDDSPEQPIWQGKDYSNPRVRDFVDLHKPFEDIYDRNKVPRMPWHDVGLQIVGQPARDAARHFTQRWNWLLRIKNHSREMPCLLPPPEFKESDLLQQDLTGTCELQLCRSAGPWSMGLQGHVEHSIQTAYIKAIQTSEHFVYIENQFFITSTVINETRIENKIGDAIVDRVIQAHHEKKPWKCCILIPLLPGFPSPVDSSQASSVRIILECQNRTISRGPHSIYSRLRKEGIDPNDYISFFSLRNWGKMQDGTLTTEQVYIHGKVCIVDDRLVIIGSANINERSMRGDRDSEIAAIIRDTDMIDGAMAGETFKVGRFAHSLRVRLMREHLGLDVDALDEETFTANDRAEPETRQDVWDLDAEQKYGQEDAVSHIRMSKLQNQANPMVNGALDTAGQAAEESGMSKTARALHKIGLNPKSASQDRNKALSEERKENGEEVSGFSISGVPTLEEKLVLEQNRPEGEIVNQYRCSDGPTSPLKGDENDDAKEIARFEQSKAEEESSGAPANAGERLEVAERPSNQSLNQSAEASSRRARSFLRHDSNRSSTKAWTLPTRRPQVEPRVFEDPIVDSFWKDIWVASAIHNTEIYRKVFYAVPDDLVTTWKQYKDFVSYHERTQKLSKDIPHEGCATNSLEENRDSQTVTRNSTWIEGKGTHRSGEHPDVQGSTFSRPTKRPEPFDRSEREEMEKLLGELNGHLVVYPTKFLEAEDIANNFLFNADRLLPLLIYD